MLCAEIEDHALATLRTDSREVDTVWSGANVREGVPQVLTITPERDNFPVEVYKCPDDVTNGPGLAVTEVISVPFLDSHAIIRVRGQVITDTVLRVECRLEGAPSNLHQARSLEHHLIVKSTAEDTYVCANRIEGGNRLKLQFISPVVQGLAVLALFIESAGLRANASDLLALSEIPVLVALTLFLGLLHSIAECVLVQIHRLTVLVLSVCKHIGVETLLRHLLLLEAPLFLFGDEVREVPIR